jgi:hypothetical protein
VGGDGVKNRYGAGDMVEMCSMPKPRRLDRRPDETTAEWLRRVAHRTEPD